MGMRKAGRAVSSATDQSYEDVEGLVVNAGIIGALLLSFALPLLVSVGMEVFERGDFRYLLYGNMDFRNFVIEVLDTYDIGRYEYETFKWNVQIEGNTTVNVKEILWIADVFTTSKNTLMNQNDEVRRNLEFAYQAIIAEFPMWHMHAWRARHPEVVLNGGSDAIFRFLSVSCGLLMWVIVSSMFLYVSLTTSSAREDAATLKAWSKFGMPFAILLYLKIIVGLVVLFFGMFSLVYAYAPTLKQGVITQHFSGYVILIPGSLLSCFISIVAYCVSFRAPAGRVRTSE